MRTPPFSELTPRQKSIEVLRWLGVLPAAVIAHLGVSFAASASFLLVHDLTASIPDDSASAGFAQGIPGGSGLVAACRLLLAYALPKTAFAVAGAELAPRYQARTAMLLTLLGFVISIWVHGPTNYLHVSAETAGLLLGTALTFRLNRHDDDAVVSK
jgi:hypothetical protein